MKMQLNENCSVTKGWLQKACRFSIRHTLKVRYFVLSDSELRYYKHPTDTQPTGIIELKNFHSVHMQNSTPLYGFRIISEHKNQWTPTLYADSSEERNTWIRRIQATLNRIQSDMILCYSPQDLSDTTSSSNQSSSRRHSIHSHHHHHHFGMLDRWLDKFDLHDKRDDDNHNINSSITNKYNKNNSININNSIYNDHRAAIRNSIDTPISQRSYDSFACDSIFSDTTMYDRTHTPPLQSKDLIFLSTPPSTKPLDNTITKGSILSTSPPNYANLEMERVIYLLHTSNRRSKRSQFYSGPIIPLSPPPRR